MSQLLVTFGVLIVLGGLGAAVRPRGLIALVNRLTVGTGLRLFAFVVRAGLGTIMILVAGSSSFPLLMRVIGSLVILAGLVVLLLGNDGMQRLIKGVLRLGPVAIVIGGLIGIALGGFLIYANI